MYIQLLIYAGPGTIDCITNNLWVNVQTVRVKDDCCGDDLTIHLMAEPEHSGVLHGRVSPQRLLHVEWNYL